jgi:hypothetical protein
MTFDIHYASLLIKIIWVFRVLCGSLLSVLKSTHVTIIFFCTPVHNSAQGMIAGTDNKPFRASQHFPSPGGTGSAVSAWFCNSIGLFYLTMLVREPAHGMQGHLERQRYESLPKPRRD